MVEIFELDVRAQEKTVRQPVATCPDLKTASRVAAAIYSCYGGVIQVQDGDRTWYVKNEKGCPTRGQICRAAQRVRDAQRAYFKGRGQDELRESKAAEGVLDKLLREYEAGPPVMDAPEEAPAQLTMDMGAA